MRKKKSQLSKVKHALDLVNKIQNLNHHKKSTEPFQKVHQIVNILPSRVKKTTNPELIDFDLN